MPTRSTSFLRWNSGAGSFLIKVNKQAGGSRKQPMVRGQRVECREQETANNTCLYLKLHTYSLQPVLAVPLWPNRQEAGGTSQQHLPLPKTSYLLAYNLYWLFGSGPLSLRCLCVQKGRRQQETATFPGFLLPNSWIPAKTPKCSSCFVNQLPAVRAPLKYCF